jgi:hypothetical protein
MDGLDNILVARTAAQVTAQAYPDLQLAGVGVLSQQGFDGQQKARRTEATLKAVRFMEGLLDRMQLSRARRQTFHRSQLGTICLHREEQARAHGLTVPQDGARAAYAVLAAHVGTSQAKMIAQEVNQ